jgi:Uma2 family endonuclease
MTPAVETPPQAPKKSVRPRRGRRTARVHNVDWDTYEKLLTAFGDRRNPRMVYDRGELEIMSPISREHERDAEALAHFVWILTEELEFPILPGGGFTMKRKDLKRGIEPDRCFWIANAPKLAGVRTLDLTVHPAPDLAIEVDLTSSSLSKFGIFAKLGVLELWRLEGNDLRFYRRGSKGKYVESPSSSSFPMLESSDLLPFLKDARAAGDQSGVTRAFRAWIRERIASPKEEQR